MVRLRSPQEPTPLRNKKAKMPGFPTQTVGTPTDRGKARRYMNGMTGLKTRHYKTGTMYRAPTKTR